MIDGSTLPMRSQVITWAMKNAHDPDLRGDAYLVLFKAAASGEITPTEAVDYLHIILEAAQ